MSYYNNIKKLDEESLLQLREGTGPADECICSVLSPPEDEKSRLSAMGASIKRAFASLGSKKNRAERGNRMRGMTSVDIPLTFNRGGKGVFTTKEVVKRNSSCGKCGCDKENIVLKHSYANIRISAPDVSSICPCPTDCLPDKAKLQNNIHVTVERVKVESEPQVTRIPIIDQLVQRRKQLDPDSVDSEASLCFPQKQIVSEPLMEKRSISELINEQYDDEIYSDWSYDDDSEED